MTLGTTNQLRKLMPERLKEARSKVGLTQEAFAAKVRVHRVTVARWELGELLPSREHLDKICAVTGQSRIWFESIE